MITKGFILHITLVFVFLTTISAQDAYRFFIAGHTGGLSGLKNEGLHPPFMRTMDHYKSSANLNFGFLLGDMVTKDPTAADWEEVMVDVAKFEMPIYFAPGNHDLEDLALYEEYIGDRYYHFTHENDLFIVLDPLLDRWNISGEQLEYLQQVLNENFRQVDHIFVFFHQVLWWERENKYGKVRPNSKEGRASQINFWDTIVPIFHALPNRVTMCAGDMGGAPWSHSLMYDRNENIEFIGTGMGSGRADNFVVIDVDERKKVSYEVVCLDTIVYHCMGPIENHHFGYTVDTSTYELDFNVYPNPARNWITVTGVEDEDFDRLSILDLSGKIIVDQEVRRGVSNFINVHDFIPGIYMIVLQGSENKIVSVIKQ